MCEAKQWIICITVIICSWKEASSAGYMSTFATFYYPGFGGNAVCTIEAGSLLTKCYGYDYAGDTFAPNDTQFWKISGGGFFGCGLTYRDRTPVCWGQNPGSNTSSFGNTSYSDLNAGGRHVCALKADGSGRLDCWGDDVLGVIAEVPNMLFTSVTCGMYFCCGLSKSTSKAVCWGQILEENASTPNISQPEAQYSAIFAGQHHVCGIEKDTKRTLCWGSNRYNNSQPPSQYNFSAISAGYNHTCGIREDTHEAVCWGDSFSPDQQIIYTGVRFSVISAGDSYTCGVSLDKPMTSLCWGTSTDLTAGARVSQAPCQHECGEDQYALNSTVLGILQCPVSTDKICIDCSRCANGTKETSACGPNTDRICESINIYSNGYPPSSSNGYPPPSSNGYPPSSSNSKSHINPKMVIGITLGAVAIAALVLASLYWRRHYWPFAFILRSKYRKLFKDLSVQICNCIKGPDLQSPPFIRRFSSAELRAATQGYSDTMVLGTGAHGMVYKGILADGSVVAVKKSTDPERAEFFDQELKIISQLNHACLAYLIGFCREEKVLVYEFMHNGSLEHCLFAKKCVELDWKTRMRIAAQAARGLEYLHVYAKPQIIHRDVKAANILLDKDWNAHVADFGVSVLCDKDDTHVSTRPIGTILYLDPEYYQTGHLTTKSDVYSFGVVLLELLSGQRVSQPLELSSDQGGSQRPEENASNFLIPRAETIPRTIEFFDASLATPLDVSPLFDTWELACKCIALSTRDRPTMAAVATSLKRYAEKLESST